MPAEEPKTSTPAAGDNGDDTATPAARPFVHGDVLEGYKPTWTGAWPGRPEYATIDWSTFREYWAIDGRMVLVDPTRSLPAAVVSDIQVRLDNMGVGGGVEVPDANGIRPSEDLVLRVGHIGKQLITVRPYVNAGVLEWRSSMHDGSIFTGADRETVTQLAHDWVATQTEPAAWVVAATTRA